MLPAPPPARRAVIGAIGAGALAGALLFGAAATAGAQPPPPAPPIPPPCTAAEMARVMSGVTFDTSNYLATHPDVNNFFTSLKGQPKDQIGDQVQHREPDCGGSDQRDDARRGQSHRRRSAAELLHLRR